MVKRGKREPVVGSALGNIVCERFSRTHADADRVAVIAQFSLGDRVSRSLNTLAAEFVRNGYRVLVVSASEVPGELRFAPEVVDDVTVLRKPNIGYDFGSWALGLAWDPAIARRPHVILANDSMVGPFAPLDPILRAFESSASDVFGLTESTQFRRHLQSYFVGYRNGVLADRVLDRFWKGIRHETDKNHIIQRNEIGVSSLLRREGYVLSSAFRGDQVGSAHDNPTIVGWRRLLDVGFPFVKREIVRRPDLAPHGDRVSRVLQKKFDVDVEEWL